MCFTRARIPGLGCCLLEIDLLLEPRNQYHSRMKTPLQRTDRNGVGE